MDVSARELVAIDTDRHAIVISPGGNVVSALTCQNGTILFRLAGAGAYKIVIAGARIEPGSYRIVAERVTPVKAEVPSLVSGSAGDGARVAVVRFQKPVENVLFTTNSVVRSSIVGRDEGDDYGCGGRGDPISILFADSDEPHAALDPDLASTASFDSETGERLLVITGARGASFRGTLSTEPSFGG